MSDLVVARVSGVVMLDGRRRPLRRGVTIARVGHPIVAANPRLWEPLTVHYDVDPVEEAVVSDETAAADASAVSVGEDGIDQLAYPDGITAAEVSSDLGVSAEEEAAVPEGEGAGVPEGESATAPVEQATAAPGELRNVARPAKKAAKKAARPATDDGK